MTVITSCSSIPLYGHANLCGISVLHQLWKDRHEYYSSNSWVGLFEQLSLSWSSNIFFSGLQRTALQKQLVKKMLFQICTRSIFAPNDHKIQYNVMLLACWQIFGLSWDMYKEEHEPEHLGISHTAIDVDVQSEAHSSWLFSWLTFIASIQAPIVTSSLLNIRKLKFWKKMHMLH